MCKLELGKKRRFVNAKRRGWTRSSAEATLMALDEINKRGKSRQGRSFAQLYPLPSLATKHGVFQDK